ncbi:MAG: acetylornithine deacetylase [Saprospiraceae bacterium]|jgi:acetylornithine deacetylase
MIVQVKKILKDLVGFDTTSHLSNLELIAYIQDYLGQRGILSELVPNEEGTKANLYATIGDASVPGLVLSGHTDVVPVTGQPWSSDPFELLEVDEKLYGRGTCDMKGYIAVCLAMTDTFIAAKMPVPIHYSFSYDEEIGCIGVRDLIEKLDHLLVKPLGCIVGEPTNMQCIGAHKGLLHSKCSVKGCPGHSSAPDKGVNAIFQATKLVAMLQEIGDDIKQNGPFDHRFEPPYSTVHVGTISGGVALNIIPQNCEFEFEFRNIPSHDVRPYLQQLEDHAEKQLLPAMQSVSTDTGFRWDTEVGMALDTPDDDDFSLWIRQILVSNQASSAVSYGTEAGMFSEIGIPTVVCGPGSIDQAHRPNEFVEISELQACIDFLHLCIADIDSQNWINQ